MVGCWEGEWKGVGRRVNGRVLGGRMEGCWEMSDAERSEKEEIYC
jgi:hypothetical protein